MSKTLKKGLSLLLAVVMVLGLGAFNIVSADLDLDSVPDDYPHADVTEIDVANLPNETLTNIRVLSVGENADCPSPVTINPVAVLDYVMQDDEQENVTNFFGNWLGDFAVSFSKEIKAVAGPDNPSAKMLPLILVGRYPVAGILGVTTDKDIPANYDVPLLGSVGYPLTYNAIRENVQDFICGAVVADDAFAAANPEFADWEGLNSIEPGTEIKVSLRLYSPDKLSDDEASQIETKTGATLVGMGDTEDDKQTYYIDIQSHTFTLANYKARLNGTPYATLEAAYEAASEGETIYLMDDVAMSADYTINNPFIINKAGITLDLDGHRITNMNNFAFVLAGDGIVLTNGTLVSRENTDKSTGVNSYLVVVNDCKNVKISNITSAGGGISVGGSQDTWKAGNTANAFEIIAAAAKDVVIEDCNIVSGDYYAVCSQMNSSVTINSGTYTANSDADSSKVLYAAFKNNDGPEGYITVKGGTFTGTITGNNASWIKLQGGTYSVEPNAGLVDTDTGYSVVKTGDSEWQVIKGEAVATVDGVPYTTLAEAFAAAKENSTVTIFDGATLGDYVVVDIPDGVTVSGGSITFTKDTVTGENASYYSFPIWLGALGDFTIENVTINGTGKSYTFGVDGGNTTFRNVTINSVANTALCFQGGKAVVENVTVNNSGLYNGQETNWRDTALALASSSSGQADVTVKSGKFTSENGYAIYIFSSGGTLTVEGGEFSGKIVSNLDKNTYDPNTAMLKIEGGTFTNTGFEVIGSPSASIVISGGTFDSDPSDYVADGYTAIKTGESKWEVVAANTYVAQIGNKPYATLAEAIADVPADGTATTITMIADATINVATSALTIPANKNVVLDLNGHEVTGYCESGTASALITNNGTLTLKDSSDTNKDGTGSGKMYAGANPAWIYDGGNDYTGSYASNMIKNNGNLTIESGYYESTTSGSAAYVIDNYNNGVVVINGGHLYNYHTSAIRLFCNSTTAENSVTVNGGIVEGYCPIWMQNASGGSKNYNGSLTITGGKIYTTEKAVVNGTTPIYDGRSYLYAYPSTSNMSLTISGGEFYTNVADWGDVVSNISGGVFKGYVYFAKASHFMTGGNYVLEPYEEYIAKGYRAVQNSDGVTWDVVEYEGIVIDENKTVQVEEGETETKYYSDQSKFIQVSDTPAQGYSKVDIVVENTVGEEITYTPTAVTILDGNDTLGTIAITEGEKAGNVISNSALLDNNVDLNEIVSGLIKDAETNEKETSILDATDLVIGLFMSNETLSQDGKTGTVNVHPIAIIYKTVDGMRTEIARYEFKDLTAIDEVEFELDVTSIIPEASRPYTGPIQIGHHHDGNVTYTVYQATNNKIIVKASEFSDFDYTLTEYVAKLMKADGTTVIKQYDANTLQQDAVADAMKTENAGSYLVPLTDGQTLALTSGQSVTVDESVYSITITATGSENGVSQVEIGDMVTYSVGAYTVKAEIMKVETDGDSTNNVAWPTEQTLGGKKFYTNEDKVVVALSVTGGTFAGVDFTLIAPNGWTFDKAEGANNFHLDPKANANAGANAIRYAAENYSSAVLAGTVFAYIYFTKAANSDEQTGEFKTTDATRVSSDIHVETGVSATNVKDTLYKAFKITWVDGSATSPVTYVISGDTPAYPGTSNPTKDADAQYTYTFKGWNTTDTTDTTEDVLAIPAAAADATYYAVFHKEPNIYTVTYDKNTTDTSATVTLASKEYVYGTNIGEGNTEQFPTGTSDGYTLAGWYTDENPETVLTELVVTGDVTLKAKWVEKSIKIIAGDGVTVPEGAETVNYTATEYTGASITDDYNANYKYTFKLGDLDIGATVGIDKTITFKTDDMTVLKNLMKENAGSVTLSMTKALDTSALEIDVYEYMNAGSLANATPLKYVLITAKTPAELSDNDTLAYTYTTPGSSTPVTLEMYQQKRYNEDGNVYAILVAFDADNVIYTKAAFNQHLLTLSADKKAELKAEIAKNISIKTKTAGHDLAADMNVNGAGGVNINDVVAAYQAYFVTAGRLNRYMATYLRADVVGAHYLTIENAARVYNDDSYNN